MVTPCDCALSGLRAVPKTVNPRSASSRGVAWPMPDDAPVTKIVCDIDSPEDCVSDNNTRRRSASQGRAQARAVRSRAAVSGIARAAPEEMRAPGHRTGACRHRAAIVRRAGAARRADAAARRPARRGRAARDAEAARPARCRDRVGECDPATFALTVTLATGERKRFEYGERRNGDQE